MEKKTRARKKNVQTVLEEKKTINLRIIESMTGRYRIADKVGGTITVDYKLAKEMIRDGYAIEI